MRARGVVVVVVVVVMVVVAVVVAVGVVTARTFTYIAAITGSKAPMHDTHFWIYVENTNNPLLAPHHPRYISHSAHVQSRSSNP